MNQIHYNEDGSIDLTLMEDGSVAKTQTIPAGTSDADVQAALVAFFPSAPAAGTSEKAS